MVRQPDAVVLTIAGKKLCLWRAVDRDGFVPDVLVQSRRAVGRLIYGSHQTPST